MLNCEAVGEFAADSACARGLGDSECTAGTGSTLAGAEVDGKIELEPVAVVEEYPGGKAVLCQQAPPRSQ